MVKDMLDSLSIEDLRQIRDFVSLCVDMPPEGFKNLLAVLNDAILKRTIS